MQIVFSILTALFVLWIFAFSGYCAYIRIFAKIDHNKKEIIGTLIWKWGEIVIIATVLISVITMSLIFANLILIQFGMPILIGS